MKVLLIKPKWFHDGDGYKYKDLNRLPPLNLGIIAALSEGHEVKIIDEDVENIEYSPDWDLVGITAATFTSNKAYAISERFRRMGVKTVLGGVHPSLMPEEALGYSDSIVVGEAEPVWERLLYDLEKENLQKLYRGGCLEDMNKIPLPRRDLFSKKYYSAPLQITRGCSNSCKYCYLQSVPWGRWRKREDLDRIYEEMSQITNHSTFIIDDNIFIEHDYAKRVFKKITPLKKNWGIQAPTTIASDDELLEIMVKSGCYSVGIGIQTINPKTVEFASIKQNRVNKYKEIVRKLKKAGMLVEAFFIFGFDTDDKNSFSRTVEAIKYLDIDDAICYILTPYPGTVLFKEFEADGRILTYDWSKYSWWNPVFRPKHMSAGELKEGLSYVYEELHKYYRRSFLKKAWQHKKRIPENLSIAKVIIKSYFMNKVDVKNLP